MDSAGSPNYKRKNENRNDEEDESEFDDGYESDLMGGDSDRDELENMTELDREKVLSMRHKRRLELKRAFDLKKEIKEKSKRRKLDGPNISSQDNSSEFPKTIYQPKMMNMKLEDFNKESKEKKSTMDITIEDLERVRLKRGFLEKIVNNFNFEEIVTGAFVRVISPYSNSNITKYVIAEIIGITEEAESYKLESKSTKKSLILKHAHKEKKFKMSYISNGDFQESEFILWVHNMGQHQQFIPSKAVLQKKMLEIHKSQANSSTEDIDKVVLTNIKRIVSQNKPVKENYSSEILFLETKIGSLEYESFLNTESNFEERIREYRSYLSILRALESQYKEKALKESRPQEKTEKLLKRRLVKVTKPKTQNQDSFVCNSFSKRLQSCVTSAHYEELMESFKKKFNEFPLEI